MTKRFHGKAEWNIGKERLKNDARASIDKAEEFILISLTDNKLNVDALIQDFHLQHFIRKLREEAEKLLKEI